MPRNSSEAPHPVTRSTTYEAIMDYLDQRTLALEQEKRELRALARRLEQDEEALKVKLALAAEEPHTTSSK